jgi:hypothetical protein
VHAKVWEKPNGKRKLRICRHRWKVIIKMDLQELEWEDIDWITQDKDGWRALVKTVMNLQVP